ncbi:MAG: beta strand repeat-containing protein, partial [Mycobacterium sp.]
MNPASLTNGTIGTAYSQTVSASGGTAPYTFSVTVGTLPAGLSLNGATGAITGTPTTAATSNFTIRAVDSLGAAGTRAYSVTVNVAITVNPASLPAATVGVAYNQTISASGGNGSFTYSVSAGTLPAGLSLNASSGVISGTPTTAGASSFTIRATDGTGAFGARVYSVTTAAALTVNPASLPGGTVGTAYSRTITATGGTAPYTFAVSAGTLPAGLTLNAGTGVIAGTPTSAATSSFTIRATSSTGVIGTRAYSVTINPAIVVSPATLPGGSLGTAYSQTVTATGGTGSYTFSVSAGSLGAGLVLNAATGVISGTPTATGVRNFTIRATDGNATFGSRAYSVTIAAAIVVNPASLPGGSVGSAYSRTVTATGGTGVKTFSISAGALPAGLSLNAATGVISGTPSGAGPNSFTVQATDTLGAIGTRAYSVTINPAIVLSPTTLPNGTSGTPYSRTISATGGTGTFTYSVSAGALGGGLTLNATTGVISGTPTTVGTRNFTIRATDGNATFGSQAYTVTINAAIVVNPATLVNGAVGTPYSRTITATGGSGSYTFSVSAGTLPAGLALNASSGVISGTPTTVAASTFTIRATDTLGAIGSRAYTVTITAPPIVVNPSTLPGGAVSAAYSQTVSATGGTGSYTFSVSAGSLGAGLALNAATGVISGTPTVAGVRNFTIRATDTSSAVGSRAYSITISAAIVVNPASLPGGTAGTAYAQTVTASGGSGAFTYAVSAGALPVGLSLNAASGVISGTPASAGSNSFTIRATDGNGASGSRAYTVTIAAAPIVVNPSSLPNGAVGAPYSQTVSATGGNGSFTYSVSAGALPAGLSLNASSGVISG